MPTSLSHNSHPSIDLEDIDSHWPPIADLSDESPAQRNQRLQHEREAKRINDEIDAQIEIEKSERRKRRPDIRIILLGTSLCLVHLPPPSAIYQNFTYSSLPLFPLFLGMSLPYRPGRVRQINHPAQLSTQICTRRFPRGSRSMASCHRPQPRTFRHIPTRPPRGK